MKANTLSFELLISRALDGTIEQCWPWQHACNRKGYGQIKIKGVLHIAQRAMWQVVFGPIPVGYQVCHSCDNPPCINPWHLFLGDNDTNVRDSMIKLRRAKKLTPDLVRAIRADLRSGRTIGREYGIAQQTVSDIKRGLYWEHVS